MSLMPFHHFTRTFSLPSHTHIHTHAQAHTHKHTRGTRAIVVCLTDVFFNFISSRSQQLPTTQTSYLFSKHKKMKKMRALSRAWYMRMVVYMVECMIMTYMKYMACMCKD